MAPDFLDGRKEGWKGGWMETQRRKQQQQPRPHREQKHAIRAAVHCEAVITRANERAISPHIKVLANEGLFIIGKHKSSHNPISCPLIPPPHPHPAAGPRRKGERRREREAHLDRQADKQILQSGSVL